MGPSWTESPLNQSTKPLLSQSLLESSPNSGFILVGWQMLSLQGLFLFFLILHDYSRILIEVSNGLLLVHDGNYSFNTHFLLTRAQESRSSNFKDQMRWPLLYNVFGFFWSHSSNTLPLFFCKRWQLVFCYDLFRTGDEFPLIIYLIIE